jgi:hypothetical protein
VLRITELEKFNDRKLTAETDAAKFALPCASGAITPGFNLPFGEATGVT